MTSKIAGIDLFDKEIDEAFPPMSVTVRLEDDVDVSPRRHDLPRVKNAPKPSQDIDAMICWMTNEPLRPRQKLAIKHTTRTGRALVKDIQYRLDVNTLHRDQETGELGLNEIGRVQLRTTVPLLCDPYSKNRTTGSFILIDEATGVTVGAGMINSGSGGSETKHRGSTAYFPQVGTPRLGAQRWTPMTRVCGLVSGAL